MGYRLNLVKIYYVCMCSMYVPGGCRGQKVSDSLELDLGMVVNHTLILELRPGCSTRATRIPVV